MLKNLLIITLFVISSFSAFAQQSVNDYKYVIVPDKYDFLSEADQYQLNSISHFLFNKYGFTALKEDDTFPQDLRFNPCLALKADVIKDPSLFKTKMKIQLKNCNKEIVYLSEEGFSFEKKYAVAYNKALRDAFLHVQALNYKYTPNEAILAMGSSANQASKQEIEDLKKEIASLKEENNSQTDADVIVTAPAPNNLEGADTVSTTQETLLFAQKTDKGYQLVDKSSKVVMVLLSTRNPEAFMVQGKNAMVYKEDGSWILSENTEKGEKNTKLNIKL
ncbi:hypothetical protein OS188_07935 [Xanthomarina sp. F1114]|uniref:hypothetical protein n=1 Tax=Xanthomarina sp. F1114 TaxID=2996019 RepID=UPI00225E18E2|nr:hypothetical protein [Xanthomarina sp. F1114]MCX7547880.1 hypothetical protein [Xanthomarina sp. F1114]